MTRRTRRNDTDFPPASVDAAIARALRVTASEAWELDDPDAAITERASGAYVWDIGGRRYVDFTSCSGAAPLGAGFRPVLERASAHMFQSGGVIPGTLSTLRIDLAERLVEEFPCAERAIFFRTGSCATTAAVRLARVYTGKAIVLTSGFHGWHDWQLQYRPHLALPDRDQQTIDFGYDLDRLGALLSGRDPVAAVIVTPEVSVFPPQYAHELDAAVRRSGTLLIVDEVMTGFRYARGGYHRACGLTPDLVTISKGLANGFALSAVIGRGEVMRAHEKTFLSHTYQRETTPFAAALATLDAYGDGGPLERCHAVGARLMAGLNELFASRDLAAWALGWPSMFDTVFADPRLGARFFNHMRQRRFLMRYGGRFMPSAATSDQDVQDALDGAAAVLDEIDEPGGSGQGRRAGPQQAVQDYASEHFAATRESVRRWFPVASGAADQPT